jgi:hypothetical protein
MERAEVHVAMKTKNVTDKQLLAADKKWSTNVLAFSKGTRSSGLGIRQVVMLRNVTQYLRLRWIFKHRHRHEEILNST